MGMFTAPTWSGRPARWLYITAIFELVLAGVFAVIGFQSPLLRSGFYLTAAILGGVALLLLLWARRWGRRYAEAQRIRTHGLAGQARIVSMTQTGVYLNEQPQVELTLEVTTPVQGPYQVTVKEYVPLIALGRLSSGMPLPVKVDPADPNNVVIEWQSPGGMMGGPGTMAGVSTFGAPMAAPAAPTASGDSDEVKARVLAEGIPGKATVLQAQDTGQVDAEGRRVYDLLLFIQVDGQPPMQGPARTGIPPERLDQLEQGDTVPIKADRSNPAVIAVDWDSA
ncbi:MAG TPA: hypothetical protein VHL78_11910 [Actinomycetota bacterium]|nr:hypothetical protein [Actinomycetota bacterium]